VYKESVHYILISLYLLGVEKIKIISKHSISLKDRRDIRRITELYTKYVISYEGKNFLELRSEYSIQNIWQLIFKAFNTLESILNHYLQILTSKGAFEYEDIEEIEAMDNEVDFLRRDLERLHSRSLLKGEGKLDLKSQDILVRIAIILERMVDHLNSIARLGYEGHVDLATLPDYIAKLKSMVNYLMDIISDIKDAYLYSKEIADFNSIIRTLVNIIREKTTFHSVLKRDVVIDLIKYHMLRLYDYLTDITELIIDWVVKLHYVDSNSYASY
jgi:hypothetical protein